MEAGFKRQHLLTHEIKSDLYMLATDGAHDARQVHLEKRLEDGRRRPHTLSEEELHELSFETREFSGAMLASLVNAAALAAGRAGREAVSFNDVAQARKTLHAREGQGLDPISPYPTPILWQGNQGLYFFHNIKHERHLRIGFYGGVLSEVEK